MGYRKCCNYLKDEHLEAMVQNERDIMLSLDCEPELRPWQDDTLVAEYNIYMVNIYMW